MPSGLWRPLYSMHLRTIYYRYTRACSADTETVIYKESSSVTLTKAAP